MRFSTSWPLLGLLIERPSYGYELMQRFKRVYGDTLTLSGARPIYQAIEELSDLGFIEHVEGAEAEAPSRRPRIHYCPTDKGMRAYSAWLVAEAAERRRQALLFARELSMLGPEHALEVIDRYEDEYATAAEEMAARKRRGGQDVAGRLVDEEERLAIGRRLAWAQYARGELEALAALRDAGGEPEADGCQEDDK
jgi:DNA-binding PadR family transcriptional regulator